MASLALGTAEAVIDLNIARFMDNASRAEQAINSLDGKGAGAFSGAESSARGFGGTLDWLSNKLDATRDKLNSWGKATRDVGNKLFLGVTLPIVGMGAATVNWASDLDESINKVNVLFGDATDVVMDFSQGSAKNLGMSKQAVLDYTSSYAGMLQPIASTQTELAGMSTNMTQLTADFASFHNLNPAEAFTVISSGLAGETEAVRKYGIDLSAANVEQKAMSMGLADTTANLTEQDKMLARYQLILDQTGDEQGDFARTSDSVSNKLKIQKARIQDVGVGFGRLLLPYVSDALDIFEKMLDWLDNLSDGTKKWVIGLAALAAAMGPILIGIGMMLPGLGLLVGLFAALLSPIGLLVAAGAGLAVLFKDDIANAFEAVVDKIQFGINVFRNLREAGLDPVQALTRTLITLFPQFTSVIVPVMQAVRSLSDAFEALKRGDYANMFSELAGAARNVGSAIIAAIRLIDWGAVAGALWDGLLGVAGWVGQQVLELGAIAVSVAGWLANRIPDIWTWLKGWVTGDNGGSLSLPSIAVNVASWVAGSIASVWDFLTGHVMGGHKGDGTGGATDPGFGGVTISDAVLNVLAWVKGALPDAAVAIEEWIGDVTAELTSVALSILSFNPTYDGTSVDLLIEDMIGEVIVGLSGVLIDIMGFKFDVPAITKMLDAALLVIGGAVILASVPVSIPVLLGIGAIVIAPLAGFMLAQWAWDWARNNPIEAVKVLMGISLAWEQNKSEITATAEDLIEWAINKIVPGGGTLVVSIPTVFKLITDDSDVDPQGGVPQEVMDQEAAAAAPTAADTMAPLMGQGLGQQLAIIRNNMILELRKMVEEGRVELDKMPFMMSNMVTSLGGIVSSGMPPVTGIVTAQTGAMQATSNANFTGMRVGGIGNVTALGAGVLGSIGATAGGWAGSLAGMLGTTRGNFGAMRTSGTGETNALASGVGGHIGAMVSDVGGKFSSMASGSRITMVGMKFGAIAEARSTGNGIANALGEGGQSALNRLGAAMVSIGPRILGASFGAIATAHSIGVNIGSALASGLASQAGAVAAQAAYLVQQANAAMIAKAMIASPSKVGIWIGKMIGIGPAIGIEDMIPRAMRAGEDYMDAVLGTMQPGWHGTAVADTVPYTAMGARGGGTVVTYHITNTVEIGDIVQQPGEDGEALADRVVDRAMERLNDDFGAVKLGRR